MSVEQANKRFLGVRIEDQKIDNLAFKTTLVGADLISFLRRTEVEGSLPQDGPGLIIANHPDWTSIFILPWTAVHTAHRSMRVVARDTLINPQIKEDKEVLERTGKNDFLNNDSSKLTSIARAALGSFLGTIGNPILIHRGSPRDETFEKIQDTLENDQLVGMFIQETRTPEWDLRNAMDGPAFITIHNPDIPVYLLAMSHVGISLSPKNWHRPHIAISLPFTYNMIQPATKLSDREKRKYVTGYIVNGMAEMLKKQLPAYQQILLPAA